MSDRWLRNLANIRTPRANQTGSQVRRKVEHIRAARQHRHEGTGPWTKKPRRTSFPTVLVSAVAFGFLAPFAVHYAGILDLQISSKPNNAAANSPTLVAASRKSTRRSLPICAGSRRITCIVDGDTGWHEGEKWRLVSRSGGVDAPEISNPACAAEKIAGERATRRLRSLMSAGYTLSGNRYDRYGRRLVAVTLSDGRDVGKMLIDEGLAQKWPNSSNPWCRP